MPSPKKSSSKFKPALLAASLLLAGCIAADESSMYFDRPLGPDYAPTVARQPDVWPTRVLVLPISGQVEDEARNQFELKFLAELRQALPWVLFTYDDANSTSADMAVTEDQALDRARALGADSILQVDLSQQAIYAPLRIVADARMESVESRTIFYKMTADLDARDEKVATTARRYYQSQLQSRHLPERSLTILTSYQEFLRFSGYETAKLIADSFVKQSNRVSKAQPAPSSGGTYFQSPPAKSADTK
ncbi:MAG: hypothetical protein PW734_04685 [Verrucomicrobium sp.]|nr:hypothetical protein [Verrucomicrobium sp.]